MPERVSLVSIRRSGLTKVFAACLFVLAVSPLTTPFSTFDLAEILGQVSVHADAGAAKLIQDVIDLASIVRYVPPALSDLSGSKTRQCEPPDIQAVRPLVLRI